jgi:hypothetical protein
VRQVLELLLGGANILNKVISDLEKNTLKLSLIKTNLKAGKILKDEIFNVFINKDFI